MSKVVNRRSLSSSSAGDIPFERIPGESDDEYDARAILAGRAQIAAGQSHDMSDVLDEIDRIIDGAD